MSYPTNNNNPRAQQHQFDYSQNQIDQSFEQNNNDTNCIFHNAALNQSGTTQFEQHQQQQYDQQATMFDQQNQEETPWLGNNVVQTVRNLKIINSNSQTNTNQQTNQQQQQLLLMQQQAQRENYSQSPLDFQQQQFNEANQSIDYTRQQPGKPPLNRLDTNVSNQQNPTTHRSKLKNVLAGFFQPPEQRQQTGQTSKRVIPFELPQEETFDQKIARLEQKNCVVQQPTRERVPSGDVRLRKNASQTRQMASAAVNGNQKNNLKRFSDHHVGAMSQLGDGQQPISTYTSTTLLQGNKQHQKLNNLFPEQQNNNLQKQESLLSPLMMPNVDMSIEAILQNNQQQNSNNAAHNHLDPSTHICLTESEIETIRKQPFMSPELPITGNKPDSNMIQEGETLLIEAKREKVIEIFKQSTEVHDVIETAKRNPHLQQIQTDYQNERPSISSESMPKDGLQFDHLSLVNMLMMDKHFITLLGDHLKKKPTARKVEQFMAKQLQSRLDALTLDSQIVNCFSNLNKRMQDRVARIQSIDLEVVC